MRRKIVLPLTLVFVVFFVSAAFAERGKHSEERLKQFEAFRLQMNEELGISEDQQASLEAHRVAKKEKMKALRQSLKEARSELRTVLGKYDSDEAQISVITAKIKSLQSQIIDHRVTSIQGIKTILTPEQFEAFHQKISEFREQRKSHWKGSNAGLMKQKNIVK